MSKHSHSKTPHREPLELQSIWTAIDRVQGEIPFKPDVTILDANANFLNAVGYSLEEIQGQHHRIFCDEETANSAAYEEFWSRLKSGEFDAGEYRRVTKSGASVWLQASYNPVFDEQGRVIKVIKFATDITAAKTRNAGFEARLHAIDRVQGVIEFSPDGIILEANSIFLSVV